MLSRHPARKQSGQSQCMAPCINADPGRAPHQSGCVRPFARSGRSLLLSPLSHPVHYPHLPIPTPTKTLLKIAINPQPPKEPNTTSDKLPPRTSSLIPFVPTYALALPVQTFTSWALALHCDRLKSTINPCHLDDSRPRTDPIATIRCEDYSGSPQLCFVTYQS